MSKLQWTLFTFTGIIFIVSVNIWAAKRDHKLLQHSQLTPNFIMNKDELQSLTNNQTRRLYQLKTQSDYAKCYKPYRTLKNY